MVQRDSLAQGRDGTDRGVADCDRTWRNGNALLVVSVLCISRYGVCYSKVWLSVWRHIDYEQLFYFKGEEFCPHSRLGVHQFETVFRSEEMPHFKNGPITMVHQCTRSIVISLFLEGAITSDRNNVSNFCTSKWEWHRTLFHDSNYTLKGLYFFFTFCIVFFFTIPPFE